MDETNNLTMGTKEAAKKWGYSQSTIQKWCREGLIENAAQDAPESPWHIPVNAECPAKKRRKQK